MSGCRSSHGRDYSIASLGDGSIGGDEGTLKSHKSYPQSVPSMDIPPNFTQHPVNHSNSGREPSNKIFNTLSIGDIPTSSPDSSAQKTSRLQQTRYAPSETGSGIFITDPDHIMSSASRARGDSAAACIRGYAAEGTPVQRAASSRRSYPEHDTHSQEMAERSVSGSMFDFGASRLGDDREFYSPSPQPEMQARCRTATPRPSEAAIPWDLLPVYERAPSVIDSPDFSKGSTPEGFPRSRHAAAVTRPAGDSATGKAKQGSAVGTPNDNDHTQALLAARLQEQEDQVRILGDRVRRLDPPASQLGLRPLDSRSTGYGSDIGSRYNPRQPQSERLGSAAQLARDPNNAAFYNHGGQAVQGVTRAELDLRDLSKQMLKMNMREKINHEQSLLKRLASIEEKLASKPPYTNLPEQPAPIPHTPPQQTHPDHLAIHNRLAGQSIEIAALRQEVERLAEVPYDITVLGNDAADMRARMERMEEMMQDRELAGHEKSKNEQSTMPRQAPSPHISLDESIIRDLETHSDDIAGLKKENLHLGDKEGQARFDIIELGDDAGDIRRRIRSLETIVLKSGLFLDWGPSPGSVDKGDDYDPQYRRATFGASGRQNPALRFMYGVGKYHHEKGCDGVCEQRCGQSSAFGTRSKKKEGRQPLDGDDRAACPDAPSDTPVKDEGTWKSHPSIGLGSRAPIMSLDPSKQAALAAGGWVNLSDNEHHSPALSNPNVQAGWGSPIRSPYGDTWGRATSYDCPASPRPDSRHPHDFGSNVSFANKNDWGKPLSSSRRAGILMESPAASTWGQQNSRFSPGAGDWPDWYGQKSIVMPVSDVPVARDQAVRHPQDPEWFPAGPLNDPLSPSSPDSCSLYRSGSQAPRSTRSAQGSDWETASSKADSEDLYSVSDRPSRAPRREWGRRSERSMGVPPSVSSRAPTVETIIDGDTSTSSHKYTPSASGDWPKTPSHASSKGKQPVRGGTGNAMREATPDPMESTIQKIISFCAGVGVPITRTNAIRHLKAKNNNINDAFYAYFSGADISTSQEKAMFRDEEALVQSGDRSVGGRGWGRPSTSGLGEGPAVRAASAAGGDEGWGDDGWGRDDLARDDYIADW